MSKEQKKIALSSTFNLLGTYSLILLGILNTFFIARLISPYEWGILLFAITFATVVAYFCYFLPPSAEATIQYYIPRLKNEDYIYNNEIRNFLLHVYKIRLVFTLIIYLIFLGIIHLLNFNVKLWQILLIISPSIIIIVIQNINNSILLAFQKFKKFFYINTSYAIIYTAGNMSVFLLKLPYPLIYIAMVYILGLFISLLISLTFIIRLIPSKVSEPEDNMTIKKENYLKKQTEYGLFLLLSGIVSNISGLAIFFLYLSFGVIEFITYLMICETLIGFALNISGSSRSSYTSIFSGINHEKNLCDYISIFYQLNKYILLFLCIIAAILLFFVEIYINLIYSDRYLIVVLIVQILLFSAFGRVITRNLLMVALSTDRTLIHFKLVFFTGTLNIISTIVALLYFDLVMLIVFYLIVHLLTPIFLLHLINKNSQFNLKIVNLFKPFIIFLISFIITLPFTFLINYQNLFDILILNLFINSTLRFSVFFIIFYLIIFISKYITKQEFNMLIDILPIINLKNNFTRKLIKFVEKLFPE